MRVEPTVLEGPTLRLEPLADEHAAGLLAVAAPDIFDYMLVVPRSWDLEGFRQYVRDVNAQPGFVPLAAVLKEIGTVAGISCYLDIRPDHRGLEIGNTWFGPTYQGTQVNPEAKYLMLRHAFETLGAVRVQLKTDGRNRQSQRAIAKLGATREGTLRKHIIMPDGFIRDTVMYSITDAEWPQVREMLLRRLRIAASGGDTAFHEAPL
jgi:ribosomal-protein-alanine N-acetyltransferase